MRLPTVPRPPDDRVACAGFGQFFEFDLEALEHLDVHHLRWVENEDFRYNARRRQIIADAQPALDACAECPLANRDWCLSLAVQDAHGQRVGFTGVAGATVFYEGRPVDGEMRDIPRARRGLYRAA